MAWERVFFASKLRMCQCAVFVMVSRSRKSIYGSYEQSLHNILAFLVATPTRYKGRNVSESYIGCNAVYVRRFRACSRPVQQRARVTAELSE